MKFGINFEDDFEEKIIIYLKLHWFVWKNIHLYYKYFHCFAQLDTLSLRFENYAKLQYFQMIHIKFLLDSLSSFYLKVSYH